MRWFLLGFLSLGCSVDNGDAPADSDGDGLMDLAERYLGTNPYSDDSDGDGYRDSDEVRMGTDPTDASSGIYQGGWPFNPNKEALNDPGWEIEPMEGGQVPNFIGLDAHGEEVQLYDFAGHGVPVVLDFGTEFCKPCKALAAFLATNDQDELIWNDEGEHYPWWDERYADLYRMVQEKELYWMTILFSTSDPGPGAEVCEAWDEAFPNPNVPCLVDNTNEFSQWMQIASWPSISVANDEMVLEVYENSGPYSAFRWLFPPE